MRHEEAMDAIFRPKDDATAPPGPVVPEDDTEEIGYGAEGIRNEEGEFVNIIVPVQIPSKDERSTVLIDNPECLAKKRIIHVKQPPRNREVNIKPKVREKTVAYYIKMGTTGEIFDPWGMYTEGLANRYAKHAGQAAWKFKRVTERCFKFYLDFLRTRNKAHLLNAEREVRNG